MLENIISIDVSWAIAVAAVVIGIIIWLFILVASLRKRIDQLEKRIIATSARNPLGSDNGFVKFDKDGNAFFAGDVRVAGEVFAGCARKDFESFKQRCYGKFRR